MPLNGLFQLNKFLCSLKTTSRTITKCIEVLQTFFCLTCSILCPLHITLRCDSVLIDVSRSKVITRVTGLKHITVTDDETPPTSDVVDLHTVGNVWFNVCQIEGKWSIPFNDADVDISYEVMNTL